ncbi:MAG: SRPBCC family protein [Chitinophagaceae bacterium]|nr:SRPBCC family protein [Chitinophagaceae bacterium]
MPVHRLEKIQIIPASPEVVWDFITSPLNLKTITPESMGFEVLTKNLPDKVYPGQMITYTVRPLMGIPMHWCTEITHVEAGQFFVDEQRSGPYRIWHHEHHIRSVAGGTEMKDIIHYQLPLGWLGNLCTPFLVKPKLDEIFDFRFRKIEDIFGKSH